MTYKHQIKTQITSKSIHKHITSEKARENVESPNISPLKCVNKSKKQGFIDSITSFAESSSSSKENTPIDLKDLVNTSEMIYILSIIYLFSNSQIYANTKMSRLSEFNYRIFHVNIIKRVETAARKAEEEFEYEFDKSYMIVKSMNKAEYLNFDVNDEMK